MNAVEIEEAVSELAAQPFDADNFPFLFLEAYGNKSTTIKKLRTGNSNKSKLSGGVLQRNHIHIAVCEAGEVENTLDLLREQPETKKSKATFILATDGAELQAENLDSGETIACAYPDFHNHFTFFFDLAGISSVKEILESTFDIKATGRLNKLYLELLQTNPDWAKPERRQDLNHFMARLIFCFFAEDTSIFTGDNLFTSTVRQMSEADSSNTHEIIGELFRAMDTKTEERQDTRNWAKPFPYVNGELFSGATDCPRFSKIARSYLLHVGGLDWKKINPDIFGSMIQAVANEEERGSLGMHYTSVPNILKVLNPLFLDELRERLRECGDNGRKLLNLRRRLAHIRVFDPACGSGNFLVIAYKQLREIEYEINQGRNEANRASEIPVTNFRGIEIKGFSAEIARLALIIAEYQCDVLYRGQSLALAEFLPLSSKNWIKQGNALRMDWLAVCPPQGSGVITHAKDLFDTPLKQPEFDFENEGGETYICGNPPYLGSKWQSAQQKNDLNQIFKSLTKKWKSLDYVSGWFMKVADYGSKVPFSAAFVSTNSINQGQQVPILWPLIFSKNSYISFAHNSFQWSNLASHNAGVTVVIVGLSNISKEGRLIYSISDKGKTVEQLVKNINPYLISGANITIDKQVVPISDIPIMIRGNSPTDGGNLLLEHYEIQNLSLSDTEKDKFLKPFVGSRELISGVCRYCIWIDDADINEARKNPSINRRIELVKEFRLASKKATTNKAAEWPHRFDERKPLPLSPVICIPVISSERREYLPIDLLSSQTVVSNKAFVTEKSSILSISTADVSVAIVSAVKGNANIANSGSNDFIGCSVI